MRFFAEPNVSVSASGVPLSIKPTAPGISFRSAANQAGCISACRSLDAANSGQRELPGESVGCISRRIGFGSVTLLGYFHVFGSKHICVCSYSLYLSSESIGYTGKEVDQI